MDESLLFAIVEMSMTKLNKKRISERVAGADYHGGGSVIVVAPTHIYLRTDYTQKKNDAYYLQT
jgi:hypothetical protein